jgi:hypothetical protein
MGTFYHKKFAFLTKGMQINELYGNYANFKIAAYN